MRIERALKARDAAYHNLVDTFSAAQTFGETSAELNVRTIKIKTHLINQGAPSWTLHYIDGARQSLTDALYRHSLEFASYIHGEYISHQRNSPDYYEKQGLTSYEVSKQGKRRGHYWRGSHKLFFTSDTLQD